MKLLTHYCACLVIILFIASIGGCDARGGGIGGGMGRGGGGAGARQTKQQSAESPQEEETRTRRHTHPIFEEEEIKREIIINGDNIEIIEEVDFVEEERFRREAVVNNDEQIAQEQHAEGPSAAKQQQRTRRQIPNMPSFPSGFPQPPKPEDFTQFPGRK